MTMTGQRVALVYTTPPSPVLAEAVEKLQAAGAQVHVIGPQIKGYEKAAELAGERMIRLRYRNSPVPIDRDNPPVRWSREWMWVVARNLWRKGTYKPMRLVLSAPALWWRTISRNERALRALEQADVLSAVDPGAVFSVWQIARRNNRALAISGVVPTLQELGLAQWND
jgi:hypothetical protein